jgi:hypothetical protein
LLTIAESVTCGDPAMRKGIIHPGAPIFHILLINVMLILYMQIFKNSSGKIDLRPAFCYKRWRSIFDFGFDREELVVGDDETGFEFLFFL